MWPCPIYSCHTPTYIEIRFSQFLHVLVIIWCDFMSPRAAPQVISLRVAREGSSLLLRNGGPQGKASIVLLAPIALLHSFCNLSFFTRRTLPRHANPFVR